MKLSGFTSRVGYFQKCGYLFETILNYSGLLFCQKTHLMVLMEIKAVLPLYPTEFRILNKTVVENSHPDLGQLKQNSASLVYLESYCLRKDPL